MKHMEDRVCSESQKVIFRVEVSHAGIDPVWTIRNQVLKAGAKYKMESKDKVHSLTVIDTMKDEEGQYVFHAGEQTSSAMLTVSGMSQLLCGSPGSVEHQKWVSIHVFTRNQTIISKTLARATTRGSHHPSPAGRDCGGVSDGGVRV